jgi:HlyD family secretion protein
MKTNKKKSLIIGLITVIVMAGLFYGYLSMNTKDETYSTEAVKKGSISKTFIENGEILSNRINAYYSDGIKRINKINVQVGDLVNEGDVLIEYDSTIDLEIEKIQKEIKALEYTYNEVVKGVDFETINSVKLEIESLKANLYVVEEEFENSKNLYQEGVITKSTYNAAELAVAQLKNQISILNNQYSLLVKDVSNNLRLQYEAQIESLAISLEILEKNKRNDILTANFSGIITELNGFEGQAPMAGTLVLELQDKASKAVYADFLVDEAVMIQEGMEASVRNIDLDLALSGLSVSKIYPKAVTRLSELGVNQKKVTVKILLPEDFDHVTLGANVEVEIEIAHRDNVLLVPEESVYEKENQHYVTILVNGKLEEREVVLGLENDDFYEIITGLSEGDIVLID